MKIKQGIWMTALFLLLPILAVSAQNIEATAQPENFLVGTRNRDTGSQEIWLVNSSTHTQQIVVDGSIFRGRNPVEPSFLSERERRGFEMGMDQGWFRTDQGDVIPSRQGIEQFWRLDQTSLLVITSNGICAVVDSTCFGYHEILIVDLNDIDHPISILKVDYHDEILEQWGCGNPLTSVGTIQIYETHINPTKDQLILQLGTGSNCYQELYLTHLTLVDFSVQPVQVREIPMSGGVSWSPDGNHFAYSSIEECDVRNWCQSTVTIESTVESSPTLIATFDVPEHEFAPFTMWADNETLVFRSKGLFELSDTNHDLYNVYHLQEGEIFRGWVGQSRPPTLYLMDSPLIRYYALPEDVPPAERIEALQDQNHLLRFISFNNRYPEWTFFESVDPNGTSNIERLVAVNQQLEQVEIDLTTLFPEDEAVYFVSP